MSAVIVPKSDQINAEDFIAGPRSYRIERVEISPGTEQPVSVRLAGEKRVWRPCKSMSRVLVAAWGADANAYAGRSLTLYRDPNVKWGGLPVGGIRISHMSHIDRQMQMALTETKGKRAPFVVKPLADEPATSPDAPLTHPTATLAARADKLEVAMRHAVDLAGLTKTWNAGRDLREQLKTADRERHDALERLHVMLDAELDRPSDYAESMFPGDQP
ncbi:MAG: hypothetical protein IOB84_07930 [Brevundimonas sp.]|nr:hypothetical protein [Brevundimonas sp.]